MYFVTNALARKVEKIAIESWKKVNLSPSHGYLLMLVIKEPGIQPMSLSEQLQLDPSTITRLVKKLEDKRLVERTAAGKMINIYPTAAALDLLPLLRQCVADFKEKYSYILGKEESATLVRNMNLIADKLAG